MRPTPPYIQETGGRDVTGRGGAGGHDVTSLGGVGGDYDVTKRYWAEGRSYLGPMRGFGGTGRGDEGSI